VSLQETHFDRYRTFGHHFNSPGGIAYCDARLFIVDMDNHRVKIFFLNGTFQKSFGRRGEEAGQFVHPTKISCYDHRLYVVDTNLSRIQVFNTTGAYITMFSKVKGVMAPLGFPQDAHVCDDILYIADTGNHRLMIFPTNGTLVRVFGIDKGKKKGQFQYPAGVFCFEDRLYVADTGNNRIQTLDTEGNYLSTYEIVSNRPEDIAVCGDRLFVGDRFNHRIDIYSVSTGIFRGHLGQQGVGRRQFRMIGGILCHDGALLVSDSNNNRIHVFPLKDIEAVERAEVQDITPVVFDEDDEGRSTATLMSAQSSS
jgi:hypothetical protein